VWFILFQVWLDNHTPVVYLYAHDAFAHSSSLLSQSVAHVNGASPKAHSLPGTRPPLLSSCDSTPTSESPLSLSLITKP